LYKNKWSREINRVNCKLPLGVFTCTPYITARRVRRLQWDWRQSAVTMDTVPLQRVGNRRIHVGPSGWTGILLSIDVVDPAVVSVLLLLDAECRVRRQYVSRRELSSQQTVASVLTSREKNCSYYLERIQTDGRNFEGPKKVAGHYWKHVIATNSIKYLHRNDVIVLHQWIHFHGPSILTFKMVTTHKLKK